MIFRKYLKITEKDKNKNEDKLKFQGHYEISQHWINIDSDWIEEKSITREPDFYKTIYLRNDKTKDTNTLKRFVFTIENSKNVEEMKFNTDTPIIKYHQNSSKSCCFSSLA